MLPGRPNAASPYAIDAVDGTTVAWVRAKAKQTRERALALVSELDDAQLGWRPSPGAHSMAWTLWHMARADDNFQAGVMERPLVWAEGDFAARWGYPERGAGTGMDDADAASLPQPSKSDLLAYVRRAFEAADEAVDLIDEARSPDVHHSPFMGGRSTYGETLVVSVTHDNRHLGELEYIKGLLGMRGSATT